MLKLKTIVKNNLNNDRPKIHNNKQILLKEFSNTDKSNENYLSSLQQYNIAFHSLNKTNKILQPAMIKSLNIGNLQLVENNGVRGETLSSKRHRRFIPTLKEYGVTSVIDLRDKFTNENYAEMCKENKLSYYHIPIDSFKIETSKIINNLPLLFKIMDSENYYMACALGLHRTDIAQTINYLFNPTPHEIPIMYGHQRSGIFKKDDIMRRIGSIKKEITPEQLKKIGWGNNFEQIYNERKLAYVKLNEELARKAYEKV